MFNMVNVELQSKTILYFSSRAVIDLSSSFEVVGRIQPSLVATVGKTQRPVSKETGLFY